MRRDEYARAVGMKRKPAVIEMIAVEPPRARAVGTNAEDLLLLARHFDEVDDQISSRRPRWREFVCGSVGETTL